MTPPPACVACGEPCRQVWSWNGLALVRVPWFYMVHAGHGGDPLVAWLCSRCVDAAAGRR